MNENEEKVEYTENSYTGIIIFLVIFAIIAITTTTVKANLYLEKNKVDDSIQPSTSGEKIENEESEDIDRTETDKTYVLEIDEFYTTNNLKTEEKNFFSGEVIIPSQYDWARKYEENINYLQIDGLKNDAIENKINEDIKNYAFEILNREDANKYKIAEVEANVTANFSNILSINMTSYLYNKNTYDDDSVRETKYLNYNLTNGEQIKLEEIFVEGASVKELLTEKLYDEYARHEDWWSYGEYIYKQTGKNYWGYDYETRDEEIKRLGLMTESEWLTWEYRSVIEEKVLKVLIEMKNSDLDFLIGDTYLVLRTDSDDHTHYLSIREINDKVSFYKKFLTDESIFTDEYQISKEEMCGWPTVDSEKVYFPTENFLLIETIFDDEYLSPEITKLAKEKMEADVQYAKDVSNKLFIARMHVYGESFYYDKVEINMNDYLENKNVVLRSISRYLDVSFVDKNELESAKVEYMVYAYNYADVDRLGYILESDSKMLTPEDLANCDIDKLNNAYNEIFARHGHDFVTKDLRAHFGTMIWYKPVAGKTASLEELSDIEKYNLELIKNKIAELKSLGVTE